MDSSIKEFRSLGKLVALCFYSTAILVLAECACASLIFTSFNDVPSLDRVDPKYLNWSTSSRTFPFIHILVNGLGLMLFKRTSLLSQLISVGWYGGPHGCALDSQLGPYTQLL